MARPFWRRYAGGKKDFSGAKHRFFRSNTL
jgi:hypothetical protein